MSAGRPVRKRDNGFSNDIAALTRLRVALKTDHRYPENEIALAVRDIDALIDRLSNLDKKAPSKIAAGAE